MSAFDFIGNWRRSWETSTPQQKQKYLWTGAVVVVAIIASGLVLTSKGPDKAPRLKKDFEIDAMVPNKKDLSAEQLASQITAAEKRLGDIETAFRQMERNSNEKFKQILDQMQRGSMGGPVDTVAVTELTERIRRLEATKPPVSTGMQRPGGTPDQSTPLPPGFTPKEGFGTSTPPSMISSPVPPPVEESSVAGLRIVGDEASEAGGDGSAPPDINLSRSGYLDGTGAASIAGSTKATGNEIDRDQSAPETGGDGSVYLAPGFFEGVLLTGMDAPTSNVAQRNPVPALFRIKHEAILPNFFRVDVRECFVTVSGYGVMSTERANLRTETLSCVRADGGVIETKIEGYIVGEDGKQGMRGRLVSKQGAVIARTLVAGFLSGLSKALAPQSIIGIQTNPGNSIQYQTPNASDVFESGAYQGASDSLNLVAKFYLDMAKEMFPVVEIDAGRAATVVLVHGASLKFGGRK